MIRIIKFKIIFLFIGLSFNSSAQRVKFIKNQYQAKYRVYITEDLKEANQWIYKVKGPTDVRKPGEWYVVNNPQLFKEAIATLLRASLRASAALYLRDPMAYRFPLSFLLPA